MPINTNYQTIQITKSSYKLLKEYCNYHGLKMGRFLESVIEMNCPKPIKPDERNILRVETKKGNV